MDSAPLAPSELKEVGATVRAIHDASAEFVPSDGASWDVAIPAAEEELICHNDLAPWNLIVGDDFTFIDWDGAGPSTRLWDLAYAAQAFTLNNPDQDPNESSSRLAAFVEGYGAGTDLRQKLPLAMYQRCTAMYRMLRSSYEAGREPWASMYSNGHGDHWRVVALYVQKHQDLWAQSLLQPC